MEQTIDNTASATEAQSSQNSQEEMPFALVQGEPLTLVPKDLYIPPDALEVILEAFEGPLDLLLYLIKRQNLDILEVPIADITKQYMDYIGMMEVLKLEVAAEYLVMAAMLAEIKSRMLLPRPIEADNEDDPRAELIRRLQEYERFKKASDDINSLPRMERDLHQASAEPPLIEQVKPAVDVELKDLMAAFREVLMRAEIFSHHQIHREALSVRERMSIVLSALKPNEFIEFGSLFTVEEGRMGVVVTFLSILELIKDSMIDIVQSEPFAPIYIKAVDSSIEEETGSETEGSAETEIVEQIESEI